MSSKVRTAEHLAYMLEIHVATLDRRALHSPMRANWKRVLDHFSFAKALHAAEQEPANPRAPVEAAGVPGRRQLDRIAHRMTGGNWEAARDRFTADSYMRIIVKPIFRIDDKRWTSMPKSWRRTRGGRGAYRRRAEPG